MNLFTPFYMISANVPDGRAIRVREERHDLLLRRLEHEGYAIAECTGSYKGREERSILVIDETPRPHAARRPGQGALKC